MRTTPHLVKQTTIHNPYQLTLIIQSMSNLTQKQVISRTDCKVGTLSADDYETNTNVKLTWSPVGEIPQSPVRETPVREKLAVPSGTSPGANLNSPKSDSLPSYSSLARERRLTALEKCCQLAPPFSP